MTTLLLLVAALTAPAPTETGLWGLQLGASPAAVRAQFAPTGAPTTLQWAQERDGDVVRLHARCRAQALCFAVPAEADFVFVDGALVAASLRADAQRAPAEHPVAPTLLALAGTSGLTVADATARAVGRHTRYFLRPGYTVAWVQDGPDAEIKLYLDAAAPVGRAEAAAAGAKADLSSLPGASGYAQAHAAIAAKAYGRAVVALDGVLAEARLSPLLRRQAALVLAMALAARAQRWAHDADAAPSDWRGRAEKDLTRAAALAPSLATELSALRVRILDSGSGSP